MPILFEALQQRVSSSDYIYDETENWVCEVIGSNRGYCNAPAPWCATYNAREMHALDDNGQYICEMHYRMLVGEKMPIKCGPPIRRGVPK